MSVNIAQNMKQIIIFIIIDNNTEDVWGIAPSKTQAKKQIAWFLPREYSYRIEPHMTYTT